MRDKRAFWEQIESPMADEKNDPAQERAEPERAPPEVESEIVAEDQAGDETETLTAEAPASGEDPAVSSGTPGKTASKKRFLIPGAIVLLALVVLGAAVLGLFQPWDNAPSTSNAPRDAAANAPDGPALSAPADTGQTAQAAPPGESGGSPLETDSDSASAKSEAENPAPLPPVGVPGADGAAGAGPIAGKIANDIAALKEELRRQSTKFDQALGEERGRAEALEQDMAAMRREFEAALAARAESADADIDALRAAVEKISNDGGLAATRRAAAGMALNNLQIAVEAGRSFEEEFEILARLAPDAPQLALLGRYAAQGAPSVDRLRAQFPDAARAGLAAAGREKAGGFLARLLARAQSLVSVRPATPQSGDSPRAVMSRAEAAVAKGDAAAAIREIEALSAETQAAMGAWLDMARTHVAAQKALSALRAAISAPGEE
jgi:hypothetical protein